MSLVRCYLYRHKVLIPTVARAEEGFYLDIEPVTVCDVKDDSDLRGCLTEALAVDNPKVPTPERTDQPGSVILDLLGLKKWLVFEAEATMYTVFKSPESINYYCTGRGADKLWRKDPSRDRTFEPDVPVTTVVNALVEDLRRDDDLQSIPKTGGLVLLPPPEENS